MRVVVIAVGLLLSSSCGLFPAPKGEVVTCEEDWLCGGDVASTATKKFCTDPADTERGAQISGFESDFKKTCAGVPETCIGGIAATCEAKCTIKGDCDIATVQPVSLQ